MKEEEEGGDRGGQTRGRSIAFTVSEEGGVDRLSAGFWGKLEVWEEEQGARNKTV